MEFWRQVLVHLRGVPAKLRPIHVEIVESEDRTLAHVTFEDDRGQSGKKPGLLRQNAATTID